MGKLKPITEREYNQAASALLQSLGIQKCQLPTGSCCLGEAETLGRLYCFIHLCGETRMELKSLSEKFGKEKVGNTEWGWRKREISKIFSYSVLMVTFLHTSRTEFWWSLPNPYLGMWFLISHVQSEGVLVAGYWCLVNPRDGSKEGPGVPSACSVWQLFQQQMLIPLSMFCSFWEFKNNLPNEAVLSSSYVQTDRSDMLQFRKQSPLWWQCLWTSPPRPFFKWSQDWLKLMLEEIQRKGGESCQRTWDLGRHFWVSCDHRMGLCHLITPLRTGFDVCVM